MTQMHTSPRPWPIIVTLCAAIVLAACTPNRSANRAPVDVRGTDPNAALERTGENTLNNDVVAAEDGNGIITYDGYQTVRARRGDTVSTVAARVGMSATELGSYNGLSSSNALRVGDELALPPRPGGYGAGGSQVSVTAPVSNPDPVPVLTPRPSTSIEQRPLDSGTSASAGSLASPDPSSGTGTPVENVLVAEAPATAPDGAWSPDIAQAAIERSSTNGIRTDGRLGAPPSATDPVPPEPTAKRQLESPGLAQYQTEDSATASPGPAPAQRPNDLTEAESRIANLEKPAPKRTANVRMRRPVSGPVAIGFNKGSGPSRNDGVDFAAAAGSKVVAAADGEVALVSQSLGGLGTIVLVRHPEELLTVYGRIDGVLVKKGDIVRSGQQIGIVSDAASPAEPRMHFEVRRGSESLDPMQFL